MKPSIFTPFASLMAAASSQPVESQPARFDVVAVSEGPVQYRAVSQSASFFYLGEGKGFTDSFCSPKVEKAGNCPPGKDTVFKNAHTLDSVVGGQVIYVDSNYAVRASGPDGRSREIGGDSVKANNSIEGFKYIPGPQHGTWGYHNDGVDGLLACPYNNGIYQVYVNSPDAKPPRGQKVDACVPFTAGAIEYDLPGNASAAAWQY
ncbi:uncharacterized protein N7469_002184 [Penicillium citrinum]|uniref:Uncharacterized protein n=1 Tax=Penicillium citrinum TaxID=5077 RepID=A0A9W9TTY7_PENCI|nr:uncharacterized protein N7469_002184 [Penicillium citrinum]KAJ5240593.1 hypothetical protein N7469_002184 [Penicillium citrinum]